MDRTLHLPAEGQGRDSGFAALTATFNNDDPRRRYEFSTANALWGQEGAAYRPEFLEKTRASYGRGLTPGGLPRQPRRRPQGDQRLDRGQDPRPDQGPALPLRRQAGD